MIFFGHIGITAGIVKGCEAVSRKKRGRQGIPVDYRFVMAGSVLPDLIDKPIGMFFFRSTFHNSRLFAHTLLFSAVLLLLGWLLYKRRKNSRVLFLGVGSFIHLVLDSMWFYPQILFWPFLLRPFPARPEGDWVAEDMQNLLVSPFYMGAEAVGLAILLFFFIRAARRGRLRDFLLRGIL